MIPKEKANQLVTKYRRTLPMNLTTMLDSKGCAIIAVDEIIQHIETSYHNEDIIKGSKLYWQEVKQEIEKL
jgi:hypothetical protein